MAPAVGVALFAVAVAAWRLGDPRLELLHLFAHHALAWRDFCRGRLAIGLAVYIVLYAFAVVSMVPVALIMTALSGFLFGIVGGAIGSVSGAVLGAVIAYGLGRRWSGAPLPRRLSRLGPMLIGFERDVFVYTLFLRLMPLTPFTLISLAAGFSRASLAAFLGGTALGVLPECIVYPAIGHALSVGRLTLAGLARPELLAPLAGLALLSLTPILLRRSRAGNP